MSFQKIISKRPSGTTRGFTIVELTRVPSRPDVTPADAKSGGQAAK